MSQPLENLWYTHCPAPSGLGVAVESGMLSEAFRPFGTCIQALRESAQQNLHTSREDSSIVALQDITHSLARWDFIDKPFDVNEWVDPYPRESVLKKVNKAP